MKRYPYFWMFEIEKQKICYGIHKIKNIRKKKQY